VRVCKSARIFQKGPYFNGGHRDFANGATARTMERANWRNTLPPQHPDKPSEAAKIGEVAEYGLLRSPINAALNPLSESPVSLALDGAVPYVIIRSSHLWLREFEPHAAKIPCNKIDPERTSLCA
jgi:hypothetical protein